MITLRKHVQTERKTYNADGALPVAVRQVLHRWKQAVHVINKRTEVTEDHVTAIFANATESLVVIFLRTVTFLRQTFSGLK